MRTQVDRLLPPPALLPPHLRLPWVDSYPPMGTPRATANAPAPIRRRQAQVADLDPATLDEDVVALYVTMHHLEREGGGAVGEHKV